MNQIFAASTSFTRPSDTTTYTSGDLVANSTSATSVTPMLFPLPYNTGYKIQRVSLTHSSPIITNAQFKLHLYTTSPTVTNGDNGAWLTTESGYLGFASIDATTTTFSDIGQGFGSFNTGLPLYIVTSTYQQVYGLLVATAAYVPTSASVFTCTLYGETDYNLQLWNSN